MPWDVRDYISFLSVRYFCAKKVLRQFISRYRAKAKQKEQLRYPRESF